SASSARRSHFHAISSNDTRLSGSVMLDAMTRHSAAFARYNSALFTLVNVPRAAIKILYSNAAVFGKFRSARSTAGQPGWPCMGDGSRPCLGRSDAGAATRAASPLRGDRFRMTAVRAAVVLVWRSRDRLSPTRHGLVGHLPKL